MTGLILCTVLLAPAAPVPIGPPVPVPPAKVDTTQANHFAIILDNLILNARNNYVKDSVTEQDLLEAAIRGLYDAVALPVPDTVKAAARKAERQPDRVQLLIEARVRLGNHPNLAGSRAFFAAANGLRQATDPMCGLSSPRTNSYASIDQDFGVGIELDGVVGPAWAVYQVEHGIASGLYASQGYFGAPPKPDAVPSPAAFPWRVKRVVPGSPAQKAGVKPDDIVTHLNGTEITAENVDRLFSAFAYPRQTYDSNTGRALPMDRILTLRRDAEKGFAVTLKNAVYTPESAFGVLRGNDKWDCMLDRTNKIGYIRLGPIETGVDGKIAELMTDLTKQGCRGLILDLRWCPGGYVTPGTSIAGMFLPEGATIAKMRFPNQRVGLSGDVTALPTAARYTALPLVVLIGPETIGGGELIAAALRDNNRCVLLGQRTFGRATIQNFIETGFGGMQFRITNGTSLRVNGKPRQRMPDSQPTDDWGVRPDDGLEVPATADKWAELRRQADLHTLRPADGREALPFDDPDLDPQRLAALVYLRKKLGPVK